MVVVEGHDGRSEGKERNVLRVDFGQQNGEERTETSQDQNPEAFKNRREENTCEKRAEILIALRRSITRSPPGGLEVIAISPSYLN
jgi:hypothetical protein